MVEFKEKNQEKIERMNKLREELYELLDKYGVDHLTVLEFSRKLDEIILELV